MVWFFYRNGSYKTLNLIDIKEEYSKFFSKKISANSVNLNTKKIIGSVAGKKYFLLAKKDFDLNNDAFKDKIIAESYQIKNSLIFKLYKILPYVYIVKPKIIKSHENKRRHSVVQKREGKDFLFPGASGRAGLEE